MAAFPIKLLSRGRPDPKGLRRLDLLESVAKLGSVTMDSMGSEIEEEDLRWLWRKDLVQVFALNGHESGLAYRMSFAGAEALKQAPAARRRAIDESEKARAA
jgi:hypothetical protein